MRGSPLLRALLAFGLILLCALPLARLTTARAVRPEPTTPTVGAGSATLREIQLKLTFTALPSTLRVRHLGKEIWSANPTAPELEQTVQIPFPTEGVDLEFEAKFPDGTPLAAMRVHLTDPDGGEHQRTCWGTGEIDEVLTFP